MDSIARFLTNLLAESSGIHLVGAAGVAYLGGILSSLTPCIYPMIPITVSVAGGGTGLNRSWKKTLLGGASYVLGMTLVYSFLGVAAGLTGKVFGSMTNTPGWYLGLSLLMTVAALVMMNVLPFDPQMTWERLKRTLVGGARRPHRPAGTEMSWLGAFALGASSGFIAAPCTTPVLTAILAYVAKTQSAATGLFLMTAFSLGLGTILMVIATSAGALKILPRSGGWMERVKIASGLVLLGFALYLMYRAGALGG